MSAVPPRESITQSADRPDGSAVLDEPRLSLRLGAPGHDALVEVFGQLCRWVLRHPVAAQALFSAFVAEGRRFAQTPEGQRWKAALADSELARKGRALWEGSVLNLLEDHPSSVIPSSIFDAIVHVTGHTDLMAVLERALPQGVGYGGRS